MPNASNLVMYEQPPEDIKKDLYFPVPDQEKFLDEEGHDVEYLPAPELENIVSRHVGTYEELAELGGVKIQCLWKRAGGNHGGKATLGACRRVNNLLQFFADADFIIWLAADHLHDKVTEREIEGCLYHELLHIEYDPQKGSYRLKNHDFEGFAAELKRFGVWRHDLEIAHQAYEQLGLFEQAPQ